MALDTEEMLKRINETLKDIRAEFTMARQDRKAKMLAEQKIAEQSDESRTVENPNEPTSIDAENIGNTELLSSSIVVTDPKIVESSHLNLLDISYEPHPIPCSDCGRIYLNGENVTFNVPAGDGSQRTVWYGCVDCWILRTNPAKQTEDRRPHSRACGIRKHDHGSECHSNCPTCGGGQHD